MKTEKDGNDSLSIEHKEEIQVIFYKSMDLLIISIPNNIIILIIIIIIIIIIISPLNVTNKPSNIK